MWKKTNMTLGLYRSPGVKCGKTAWKSACIAHLV